MQKRILALAVLFAFSILPAVHAQDDGKLRAMQKRAAVITKQKNDFVVRVLNSYKIPHELNAEGTVVRISMNGQWIDVKGLDIVPVIKETTEKRQVLAGHELYFYTQNEILDLMSDLAAVR